MDLKLGTSGNDVDFTDLELSFVEGQEAIAQHILMRLRTWFGEDGTVYDRRRGVPYIEVIFDPQTSDDAARFVIQQQIEETPGVLSVTVHPVSSDRGTGVMTVSADVQTIEGDVDFTTVISIETPVTEDDG